MAQAYQAYRGLSFFMGLQWDRFYSVITIALSLSLAAQLAQWM